MRRAAKQRYAKIVQGDRIMLDRERIDDECRRTRVGMNVVGNHRKCQSVTRILVRSPIEEIACRC